MSVTIAALQVPNWQRDSDVVLRIYALSSFIAADGTEIVAGSTSTDSAVNNNWFQSYACSVVNGVLSVPQIVLPSTTDSPDNNRAAYSSLLFTTEGDYIGQFGQFGHFQVAPSPASTSWAAISALSSLNSQTSTSPLQWGSDWSPTVHYGVLGFVKSANSVWLAIAPSLGEMPGTGSSWSLMIAATPGPPGPLANVPVQFVSSGTAASYADNFEADAIGTIASGWTAKVGTWAVGNVNPTQGSKSFGATSAADGDVALLTGPGVLADMELYFEQLIPAAGNGSSVNALLRMDAAYQNGYLIVAVNTNNNYDMVLFKRIGGSFTQLTGVTLAPFVSGHTYAVRARIQGTTIYAKVWDKASAEPDWMLTVSDSSVTGSGYAGLYSGPSQMGVDNVQLLNPNAPPAQGSAIAFATQTDQMIDLTLTADTSITITPPANTGFYRRLLLVIHPNGFQATLPPSSAALVWANGMVPQVSKTAVTTVNFGATGVAPIRGGVQ